MSQVRPVNPRLEHFEDAVHRTGWGLYYQFLLAFTAANLFANGLVLLCVHLALPLSACDTLLSVEDVLAVHVCFAAGGAVGGFLLASISDHSGKKCMVSKSLLVVFGSCFVCAFSHNVYTLYLAALFLGSGLQANLITSKIHLAEILPTASRGFYLVLPDIFWTLGYFFTAFFLYTLGRNGSGPGEHQGMDMRLTSWRIIFAVGGGLCISLGCTSALLETSPRYLLFRRRVVTATLVLKQFYAINRSKYSETFEIHSQQLYDLIYDYEINIDPEPVGVVQQITTMAKVMFRMLKILARSPFVKVALTLISIKTPLFFGIAGLNIFLSRHLTTSSGSGNESVVRGNDFVHHRIVFEKNCNVFLDETTFTYFLLLAVNILVGQIISLSIIDRIGRKFPIFAGLTACSLASIILAFNENFVMAMAISSLFVVGYTLVEATLHVVVIESFPTALRGTAAGMVYFYSNVVACFTYSFMSMPLQIFLTVMGAITLGTSVISCFIPDLTRRPMIE